MKTSLLKRQIKKYLGHLDKNQLKDMKPFLNAIEDAYESSENDRQLMERSLDISSEEMLIKNLAIEEKSQENKKIIENLIEAIENFDPQINQEKKYLKAFELSNYLINLLKNDKKNKKQIISHEIHTQKLNKELEKFKLAVDNASDYISILNLDDKIIYMNRSFCKYLGYDESELYGQTMKTFIRRGKDGEDLGDFFEKLKKTKVATKRNLVTIRKDSSEFISEISYTPILSKDGRVEFFLLIEHDITKELELDNLKNEFLAIASHELRTPMTVIKGYNSILLNEKFGTINNNQRKYFERIDSNITRLINIVNDMLDIGKLESGKIIFDIQEFDIGHLLKDDVSAYFEDLCSQKNITFFVSAESILINSDQEKIKQVLINLIGNAYKFTKNDGKIELILEKIGKTHVKINVIDDGIGIPKENFEKVFQKFYQVKNQLQKTEEGTGLGLPISKTIVESLGGKIGIKSEERNGSNFYFTLPLKYKK